MGVMGQNTPEADNIFALEHTFFCDLVKVLMNIIIYQKQPKMLSLKNFKN